MQLHADLALPADVNSDLLEWTASPAPGVFRRMIERDGAEQARCTSRVTYAPGSVFPPHGHPFGEEILVLSGTFHDEHGTYPVGTFMRNAHGETHAPGSVPGCELLVKLRHLTANRAAAPSLSTSGRLVVNTGADNPAWRSLPALQGNLRGLWLGGVGDEASWLLEATPGARFQLPHAVDQAPAGEELYDLATGQWLRRPPGSREIFTAPDGGRFFAKVGHLAPEPAATLA
ncbi:MAG: hypothetical protein RJB26_2066 [Pseudomonadota bacterium]